MVGFDEKVIRDIVIKKIEMLNHAVPVGVSNRHIHLCRGDVDKLFGKGYELTVKKALTQPGEFACNEVVMVMGPKGAIENVRVLGPTREQTQVELLQSDLYKLGIKADVRLSGDLQDTPGAYIKSGKAIVEIEHGVIVAKRHIHMDEEQAKRLNLCDRQNVCVEIMGDRNAILKNVAVRVKKGSYFEMHIDKDEAYACGIGNDCVGYIFT